MSRPSRAVRTRGEALVLFETHLGDAERMANGLRFWRRRGANWQEVRAAALHALWRASLAWDETRGVKFTTYLYSGVRMAVLERLRTARRVPTPAPLGSTGHGGPVDPCSATGAGLVDDRDEVAVAMRGLTRQERRLLHLRFWCGQSIEEIGPRVGLSKTGVSSKLNRLLARMRERLECREGDRV